MAIRKSCDKATMLEWYLNLYYIYINLFPSTFGECCEEWGFDW